MKTILKNVLKTTVFLAVASQFIACGKGRQNSTDSSNAFGLSGTPGTLDQKVRAVLAAFPCQSGAQHRLTVVRFSSSIPGSVGSRIGTTNLTEAGAKQVAVGVNSERNVVVVKDYGTSGMDAYLYLCPNTWNGSNTNLVVQTAQLETELETSSFNPRCSVAQVVQFNATLQIAGGYPVSYAFFPIEYLGSVPNVCESGYNNGYNYNNGYYGN